VRIHYVNCIDSNRGWGVENFINDGLVKLGHTVINTDYRKSRKKLGEIFNTIDADILFVQRGEWIAPVLISTVNYPKVLWASELVSRNREEVFYNAFAFDFLFTHDEPCRIDLAQSGIENTEVLLNGFYPPLHRKNESKKEYDVLFIGLLNERRKKIIDELSKYFNVTYISAFGEEMVKHFNKAKIVLNFHFAEGILDTETRVFEALGCGQFLISEMLSLKVFENGKHFIECGSIDEMKDNISYYLKNESEREEIASKGHKEALRKHTYFHRAQYIAKKMETIIKTHGKLYAGTVSENYGIMYDKAGVQTSNIKEYYRSVESELTENVSKQEAFKQEVLKNLHG